MLDRIAASPLKSLLSCYRWRILSLSLARSLSDAWCNKKPLAGLHFPCPESHRTRPERKLLWWQNKGAAHLLFASLLKPASHSWSLCFEVSALKTFGVSGLSKETKGNVRTPFFFRGMILCAYSLWGRGVTSACLTLTDIHSHNHVEITYLGLFRPEPLSYVDLDAIHDIHWWMAIRNGLWSDQNSCDFFLNPRW